MWPAHLGSNAGSAALGVRKLSYFSGQEFYFMEFWGVLFVVVLFLKGEHVGTGEQRGAEGGERIFRQVPW